MISIQKKACSTLPNPAVRPLTDKIAASNAPKKPARIHKILHIREAESEEVKESPPEFQIEDIIP